MIVVLKAKLSKKQVGEVLRQLSDLNLEIHNATLNDRNIVAISEFPHDFDIRRIKLLEGVQEVFEVNEPYKLASRTWKKDPTTFDVNGVTVGGNLINIIAGPCAVESEEQIFTIAEVLHKNGVKFIRGGAYKPRTSPYAFQGMGVEGLKLLRQAADKYNLRVVTEIIDLSVLDEVCDYADILQVGTRNMMNFFMLTELGKIDKPIMLKRGMSSKITEWLMSAEYILSGGNERVILCERGIRTFDNSVRNTLDVAAFPIIKELSHLPVFSDPSHGTGLRHRVTPMALASIAAGADGLMIEVHHNPELALSDGPQSLFPDQFETMLEKLKPIAHVVGRALDSE
ncbi:MAG: 3-deoxy-7-phosphoheptulonate synthase [Bacteroidetes bacterium]|nr:3-deoxy-7-phosphoheptulonate synthase [Bacteroidota bacterium]